MPTPITQEELNTKIDNYYKFQKINPSLVTEEEKAKNPYIQSLYERYSVIPKEEQPEKIPEAVYKKDVATDAAFIGEMGEALDRAKNEGVPLASEGLTILSNQISYYGIGSIVFDIIWLSLSAIGMYQAKKLWLYGESLDKTPGDASEFVWAFILFLISLISLAVCLSQIPEDIMMATAPLVWAIQQTL